MANVSEGGSVKELREGRGRAGRGSPTVTAVRPLLGHQAEHVTYDFTSIPLKSLNLFDFPRGLQMLLFLNLKKLTLENLISQNCTTMK